MVLSERLRQLREQKGLSQGDIQERSGLLRCYISRVENGYTVPAVETLEKMARALEVPLFHLFYEGEEPAEFPEVLKRRTGSDLLWGRSGKEARVLARFRHLLSQTGESDRKLLLTMAQKMAGAGRGAAGARRPSKGRSSGRPRTR